MKTHFIVNDYILIWNLLFGASISENVYQLKQKIWNSYKQEYNAVYKDKKNIVKDYKNFIPDDDTVYNLVLEDKLYEKLKKQVEKYRLEIMRLWDKNKKTTDDLINNIIRKKIDETRFFVINKEFKTVEYLPKDNIIVGREIDKKSPFHILLRLNYEIISHQLKTYSEEQEVLKKAILELAVYNEYATKLLGRSCYEGGTPALLTIKRSLYPYWLMYLGIPKEKFSEYMTRDKIVFNPSKYPYEKEFKKMDIEEFIEFCIRNQRYMIRLPKEKKANIEIL